MTIQTRANTTPWGAVFFSLLGLAFCGYIAFPRSTPAACLSSGCAIFADAKIGGISLWWIGGAYFFLLAIVCLRANRSLAWFLAWLALFIDALLLLIMFFTAPCLTCLQVAAIFGMTFYVLRPSSNGWFAGTPPPSLLLPLWFGLFLGNCIVTLNEYIPPYTLGNSESTEVRVYFSPSCLSCREAILALGSTAALYPVDEREGDVDSIIRLASYLQAHMPMQEALAKSLDLNEPVPSRSILQKATLSVQLLRNKAVVMRQGFRSVPLIQINGMPHQSGRSVQGAQNVLPESTPPLGMESHYGDANAGLEGKSATQYQSPRATGSGASGSREGHSLGEMLEGAGDLTQCEQGTAVPCPDPVGAAGGNAVTP